MAISDIFSLRGNVSSKKEHKVMTGIRGEEIFFTTKDNTVDLDKVLKLLKANEIELRAFNVSSQSGTLALNIITSDNDRAKEILAKLGEVISRNIVIVEFRPEDNPLNVLITKLKDSGVNILYLYGITADDAKSLNIAFSSSDDQKALEVISAIKWE